MFISILLMLAPTSEAATLPPPPELKPPYPSECLQAVELRAGVEMPPILKIDGGIFTASCGAIAVPTSKLEFLLERDMYAEALQQQYLTDMSSLEAEVQTLESSISSIKNEQSVWYEKPNAQRWIGRIEAFVLVGAAFAVANQVNKLSD